VACTNAKRRRVSRILQGALLSASLRPTIRRVLPRSTFKIELSRKVLHLTSVVIPAGYWLLGRSAALACLAVSLAIAVLIEVLRRRNDGFRTWFRRWFGFMVRTREWSRITGATYVLLGALLTIWLFPQEIAIPALLAAYVADSAASLTGLTVGRTRFLAKTLEGSLAFFIAAAAAIWLSTGRSSLIVLAVALVATVIEAAPTPRWGRYELNDNLTVPVLTAAVIWLSGLAQAPT
jgi:dolichol kinase